MTGLSRWALWFGGLAFFTCYLGQTVLGVIQPTIAAELGLSTSEAQWVVNSFFLTLALFAAPGGRLGDYYGHREVLLFALAIFALGSLSAAVSQGFVWLVVSIAIAGIGASTLYPSSAAMIANRVPEAHRGDALGKYSAIGVSVFTVGPVMAGLLTETISWRALFGLQAAVGVGLVLLGWLRVDNRPVGEPEPFDFRGLAVLMAGPAALLGAFGSLELRERYPLLDVGLLRRRVLRGIVLAIVPSMLAEPAFNIDRADVHFAAERPQQRRRRRGARRRQRPGADRALDWRRRRHDGAGPGHPLRRNRRPHRLALRDRLRLAPARPPYLMKSISSYFGRGQRSSLMTFSSLSAASRTWSIAASCLSRA